MKWFFLTFLLFVASPLFAKTHPAQNTLEGVLRCLEKTRAVTYVPHGERFTGLFQEASDGVAIIPAPRDPDLFVFVAQGKRDRVKLFFLARLVAPTPGAACEAKAGSVQINGQAIKPKRDDYKKNYYRLDYQEDGGPQSLHMGYGLVTVDGQTDKRLEVQSGDLSSGASGEFLIPEVRDAAQIAALMNEVLLPEARERILAIRTYFKGMGLGEMARISPPPTWPARPSQDSVN